MNCSVTTAILRVIAGNIFFFIPRIFKVHDLADHQMGPMVFVMDGKDRHDGEWNF